MYLNTERVFLRSVQVEDASLIVEWKSDFLIRKMSVGLDTDINIENQMKDIKSSLKSDEELYQLICLNDTGRPIGYIRINWTGDGMAWLRFGLGEKRKKGYAKEALIGFINQLRKEGLHRIDAEVYDYNLDSFNLLTRLGFIKEGVKREAHISEEKYSDVYVMGLLRGDWLYDDLESL
ncbi:MAG: GNAT family N-acetyltransferase [Clostridiales bacterium]|nr:GNAT family N-acetyltransferase [Clostridiales bacterium]